MSQIPYVQGIVLRKFPLCVRFFPTKGPTPSSSLLIPFDELEDAVLNPAFQRSLGIPDENEETENVEIKRTEIPTSVSETAFFVTDAVYLKRITEALEEGTDDKMLKLMIGDLFLNCSIIIIRNVSKSYLPY